MPAGADPVLGTDGRLTVLLLGSDYRPAHPGNRTDAIIVVSVEPVSGDAAAFSIPRDTIRFPLPGGRMYGPKVNGLYQHLQSTTRSGGKAMKAVVGRAYGIEVDWYAFIGFAGLKQLVNAIGGVDVTLTKPYYDAHYWVNSRKQGWGLPKGTSHLDGAEALIFARSRKGDNDFGRSRRQQQLVLAALSKVRKIGFDRVPRLLAIARETVRTDLPLKRAPALFDIIGRTDITHARRVVFGPRLYTKELGGSSFSPDLAACRKWIKINFPKARPMAHWPPAPAAPASAPPASPSSGG
jgi:LCP family protein required for cell wall assembly